MYLLFVFFGAMIPSHETMTYQTNDKGKLGALLVALNKDSAGYRIRYVSDREIDVIIDTNDFGTLYVSKLVNGKLELTVERKQNLMVNYKGRKSYYSEKGPVYDRHTLDFALRGFEYTAVFKRRIRLNIPELMVVNAELSVTGSETVSTPVGGIDCWKIKMEPRVFIVKKTFYFWIEKEYPRRFVKMSDSSGDNTLLLIKYETMQEE